MKNKLLMIGTLASALSLVGCSSSDATYDNVEQLRDAYVDAGGNCDNYTPTHTSDGAKSSASCSRQTVIVVYANHDAVNDQIELLKNSGISGLIGDSERLVGENWMINAPDLEQIQKKMGGEIVSITP